MKGCLAVVGGIFLLIVLLVGGCIGYGIYKVKPMIDSWENAGPPLEATNAAFPFTAPADGLIQKNRLEVFLAVRDQTVAPLVNEQEKLGGLEETNPEDMGFFDTMSMAFSVPFGLAEAASKIPTEMIAALNDEHMSIAEFKWIGEVLHKTITDAGDEGNEEAKEMIQEIEKSLASGPFGQESDHSGEYRKGEWRVGVDRHGPWKKQNLALIFQMRHEICDGFWPLMVDVFILGSSDHNSLSASTITTTTTGE